MLMDAVSESDNVKTELIDYRSNLEEMKTLPSVLFEESSMDTSDRNEDTENEKAGDEDIQIHVDDEPSLEGKLHIDLPDEDTNDNKKSRELEGDVKTEKSPIQTEEVPVNMEKVPDKMKEDSVDKNKF